ncbi:WD40-repeat-containing domain protein [Amylostereum chailletii]|nr:WD40-repeat-containing domain protein [Amylostereum chailletii]
MASELDPKVGRLRLVLDPDPAGGGAIIPSEAFIADRFISTRPDIQFPLDTTPRTNRIARVFGLADDRVLNFADPPNASSESQLLSSIRRSASQLFSTPSAAHPSSSLSNLARKKQFVLALDGPGVPQDPWASPLSWSQKNAIAVACGTDVYHQNLDTRSISHLCSFSKPALGRIRALAFAVEGRSDLLCMGTTTGCVQVWDADAGKRLRTWPNRDWMGVSAMSWRGREFVIGRNDGRVSMFDVRTSDEIYKFRAHRGDVLGLQWSPDQRYLLSSDNVGSVSLWDARKMTTRVGKMAHEGPVKALAWCPWKADLFATAGTYPDDTIQIRSTASFSETLCPDSVRTIETSTSVYSLHWSPHCRELLSTHGQAWTKADRVRTEHSPARSPMANSVTVHAYPTGKRLVSVPAHSGVVSQSCLGPDGTAVFTICYREEAMKMWKVWAPGDHGERKESPFAKFNLR